MKRAIKKKTIIKAYQLGKNSEMEKRLIHKGVIRKLENGQYELFSQEAVNGQGEIARQGDYFKAERVQGREFAYPNNREFFEKNHRRIRENLYEQIAEPVEIWCSEDGSCELINFLIEKKLIFINEDTPDKYFYAELWGTTLSAPKNAVVVFYEVVRNAEGNIEHVVFNLVQRNYFEKYYDMLH